MFRPIHGHHQVDCLKFPLCNKFLCSCLKAVYKPVWHILLLSVQWINSWWWTEELSETWRFSCQNKYVKLVHVFGFIIKKEMCLHTSEKIGKKSMYTLLLALLMCQGIYHKESCSAFLFFDNYVRRPLPPNVPVKWPAFLLRCRNVMCSYLGSDTDTLRVGAVLRSPHR